MRIEALQTTPALSDSYFATAAQLSDLFLGRWTIQNPEELNTDENRQGRVLSTNFARKRHAASGV